MTNEATPRYDDSLENLMVVLRESQGASKPDEVLKPSGKAWGTLADGSRFEMETTWYEFIGDMHIRLVFDGPNSMVGASPDDMQRFGLSPEEAVERAISNIKRVYGLPTASPWTRRLMIVEGRCPDLNSSYFLDRAFWRGLLLDYPDGIVVGVPKRGGLLYAPISDYEEVTGLRESIGYLYRSSEHLRVSSALYLFKDDHWSVFQPPLESQ